MAAIAAGVAAAVASAAPYIAAGAAVAGTAAGAVSASQKAKAAKKGITSTNTPTMTPMGEAIQGTMLRLLMGRLQRPPQSFADFSQSGPQAALPGGLNYAERSAYGLPAPDLPIRVQPSAVSPDVISALQALGIAPSGGPEIRQGAFLGGQPTVPDYSGVPQSGPATPVAATKTTP